MSSWGYVDQRDANLNSFTTFDDDLGWDGFEGTSSDGIVPDRESPPLEIRKGKRSSRSRSAKFAPPDQRSQNPKSSSADEWEGVRTPSLSPPLSLGNGSNSGLVPSVLDEGFEGSGAITDVVGGSLKGEVDMRLPSGSFTLDNLGSGDLVGMGPGKRLSGAVDYGYEGLGDMDVWFKGPDTSSVPWEQSTPLRNSLSKTDVKVEDDEGDELVAQVLNEDTPSPPHRDFDSGKENQSTLTSDESQSNTLYPFQDENRDWGNSTSGGEGSAGFRHPPKGVRSFQNENGGADVKPNLAGGFEGGVMSSELKEKMQMQLNREKERMNRQIHQQLVKQQKEREEQLRAQQQQGQQLFRKQEAERQFLYMQVQKQQQQQQALGPMVGTSPVPLIPEASKEDLEKLSLELSAAEPRPYPDPAVLELPMSVPSTSGSDDPAVGQDDASIKRARRQAVARRLEQNGKRVPKSPSFSNLSSKGSFSPSQQTSFHAPPPPSPVTLPGGALHHSPPLNPTPPPAMPLRPPPIVLPSEPQMFRPPPGGVTASPVQGLIPTPPMGGPSQGGFPPPQYGQNARLQQQPGLPPGPPAFRPSMYYPPQQMGGAQGTYLSPPGTGQMAWGGNAMVGVDPGLQVPADDDSAEANVFRELEGAMRTLDVGMRLTLRDSLFRLADSASQRAVTSAAASASGSTADTTHSGSNTPGGNGGEKEKVTQMIDRAVANLLYHKQLAPKPEELPPPPQQWGPPQSFSGGYGNGAPMQQMPPPGGQPMMVPALGGMNLPMMSPLPPQDWYWHDTGQGGSQMVSNAQLALPPRPSTGPSNSLQTNSNSGFAPRYKRGRAGVKLKEAAGKSLGGGAMHANPLARRVHTNPVVLGGFPNGGKAPPGGRFGVPKPKEVVKPGTMSSSGASTNLGSETLQRGGLLPGFEGGGKGQKHKSGGEGDVQGSPKLARSSETGKSGVSSICALGGRDQAVVEGGA
ncbi:hypothetical protein KFL_006050070 [Klebsormidium nitens]|uniref:Uncharacterized protein n=1 Tax=Klebsormidium nitens TaxID=105231 RepID=A0A1Y1IH11_KLENI|nr:hypothetical protein KFL_006050070 [Klebsormidium nitens]|eukprot:GAQ90145.1 hypothetical protein KFL_006050070 [Klebsormidium nitens]